VVTDGRKPANQARQRAQLGVGGSGRSGRLEERSDGRRLRSARGKRYSVETRGLEPLTPALQRQNGLLRLAKRCRDERRVRLVSDRY
jgi:hypothetical protein